MTVDLRNYMLQPLNGNMICTPDMQLCITSYLNNANGEFEYIYTNSIHDYLSISGTNSIIGVQRSAADGILRCFGVPQNPCTSPPNGTDVPEGVPYIFGVNVASLQTELAAENADGSPRSVIPGALSPTGGRYSGFSVNTQNLSTCAQTLGGATMNAVYVVYVTGVQFGGNVGTRDAIVIDEYEIGPPNHVERYFYVNGLGRVREAVAYYDSNTGFYDLNSFNSVRNMVVANTVPIPAPECPQGSTTPLMRRKR